MRGFLELLVPLYNQASASSALHLATHAVSLSALGNYPGRHRLLQDASVSYGQALRKVNLALKDPIESKSDETVLAILMFSLYEVKHSAEIRVIFKVPVLFQHFEVVICDFVRNLLSDICH